MRCLVPGSATGRICWARCANSISRCVRSRRSALVVIQAAIYWRCLRAAVSSSVRPLAAWLATAMSSPSANRRDSLSPAAFSSLAIRRSIAERSSAPLARADAPTGQMKASHGKKPWSRPPKFVPEYRAEPNPVTERVALRVGERHLALACAQGSANEARLTWCHQNSRACPRDPAIDRRVVARSGAACVGSRRSLDTGRRPYGQSCGSTTASGNRRTK
jgi:hypothetical protein